METVILIAYVGVSGYATYYLFRSLYVTRRDAAAAIKILSRVDIGLSAVLSDLEGIRARLDNLSATDKAGIESANVAAAE